jgi:hypothetical protein
VRTLLGLASGFAILGLAVVAVAHVAAVLYGGP